MTVRNVPRWLILTGGLLIPTLAFAAASAAPSGFCPLGALLGCCG